MVNPSRFGRVFAVVALGLFGLCASAQAQVFSTPKNISNNRDSSLTPQVAVDGAGNIYAVWRDNTLNNSNVLFACSTDGGKTFSSAQNISNNAGSSFTPRIAVDVNGAINVVWADNTPGYQAIFFTRSADGGATFATPKNLSNGPADAGFPQVAVDGGGKISVVWENDDITFGVFYTQSADGGANFSTPVNLATSASGSFAPQLAVDASGHVYVAWEDNLNSQIDICFSSSADQGATFSLPKNLSNNSGRSFSTRLTVDGSGNIDVAWVDNTPGTFNIFFTRSTDKGGTFSNPRNVSNSPGSTTNPQISAGAGGNIYVVWQDTIPPASNNDIFFARSADGGATFGAPMNLSNNAGDSTSPWLTVDAAGNVNVSWTDTTPGNDQIFFAQSVDAGGTFPTTQNLSNDGGFAGDAQMAADSKGNLDVFWSETAPRANQIFFSVLANPKKANQPPVANAGADQMVECTGQGCALVTLDGSKSSDPDGGTLRYLWQDDSKSLVSTSAVAQFTVPKGAHTFTLTVTNAGDLSSTALTHVTVQDTNAPNLQVSLSPNVLRPREHRLVLVKATINVSDTCDANPTVKLVSITSNDPAERGRHQTSDVKAVSGGALAFGTDVRSFLLRAEDSERGKDLVYTVTYSATDASGNTSTATAVVPVAHHSSRAPHDGGRDDDKDHEKDHDRDHDTDRHDR